MIRLGDVDLVLASSSRYRRELLARISSRFRVVRPEVDEAPLTGENPRDVAIRLARFKARAVASHNAGALVIGSDQSAALDGAILGKPGSAADARRQLTLASGRSVEFHTAICVLDARSPAARERVALDLTTVHFRRLDDAEIARYVERDQPLDCAGAFKAEALGIGLFERIDCTDPTALVGLPLIALCRLLREIGIAVI